MRRISITLALLVMASITAGIALAASPHYKKAPSCVDNGLTVTCTGALAGLGNGDVIVTVSFTSADGSTGTTVCTNKGGNQAPGQNPALPVDASGSQLITNVKNGTVSFSVTTLPPANPTSAEAGCPSGQWSATIDSVTFHGGTLTVRQDDGTGNFVVVASLTISPLFP